MAIPSCCPLIKLCSQDYLLMVANGIAPQASGVYWPSEHKVLVAPLVAIGSITGKFREIVGHVSISDLKSILVILNSYNCLK